MLRIYGEILLDMIERNGQNNYEVYLGGAPFNVAYAAKKMTDNICFIGNVGADLPGKKILEEVQRYQMDTSHIFEDSIHNTTLAIVQIDSEGERNFCFIRKNGADYHIPLQTLSLIGANDLIHLGSLMLSESIGREFARKLIQEAKKKKARISFDVNYREDIFSDSDEALRIYSEILPHCDIVKISEDELYLFTHERDIQKALQKLARKGQKIFVTFGKNGSLLYQKNEIIYVSSYPVIPVDTTGAGDAFFGTILGLITHYGFETFFQKKRIIRQSLYLANVQGGSATTAKGALTGIMTKEKLLSFLEKTTPHKESLPQRFQSKKAEE